MTPEDFYEDDESVEELLAKFERAEKVFTAPPEES